MWSCCLCRLVLVVFRIVFVLNSNWNLIFFDPICVAFTLGDLLVINLFIFHLYLQFSVVHYHFAVTGTVTFVNVTMYDLFIMMYSISVFVTPFALFHVHFPLHSSEIW